MINMWYVSADTQLYIFAFALLVILGKWPQAGLISIVTLLVISVGFSAGVTAVHRLSPTILTNHMINYEYIHEHLALTYCPTFQHVAPYCVGMLVGYLLLTRPLLLDKVSYRTKFALWSLAPLTSLTTLMAPYRWNSGHEPSLLESVAYASLHRLFWTLGVAWVAFACITGHGGLVSMVLKARCMLPLSRLSFGVYLVHLTVIYSKYFSIKQTMAWNESDFFASAARTYFVSIFLAYWLYVLFESPAIRLESAILKSQAGKRQTYKVAGREAEIESKFQNGAKLSNHHLNNRSSSFYCHCKEILKSQCSFTKSDVTSGQVVKLTNSHKIDNRNSPLPPNLKAMEDAAKAATGATILASYYSKV